MGGGHTFILKGDVHLRPPVYAIEYPLYYAITIHFVYIVPLINSCLMFCHTLLVKLSLDFYQKESLFCVVLQSYYQVCLSGWVCL